MTKRKVSYGEAIREGFEYLLAAFPECFVIGQGLWSPWYVGNTMTDLDKKFGKDRIIDTPVSEAATTGLAVGASLCGSKPIVVHPRIDFMLYAMDPIVNQAAKWSHMTGGNSSPAVTIRGIVNRGGEQGAQHSQSLHAWFAHIPGLRVVMPSTVSDARDLLIASVMSPDPVIYIDDRWLYEQEEEIEQINPDLDLKTIRPQILNEGNDLTIVATGFSSKQALDIALDEDIKSKISVEVIDMRVLNPLNIDLVIDSVNKTGNLLALDGGTRTCGYSAELISSIIERINITSLKNNPKRISLPDCPAPTSKILEKEYYPDKKYIKDIILKEFL